MVFISPLVVLQDTISFLLSSEARQLRPLLVKELVTGLDYYTRDRLQRAYNSLPSLAPRIPFLGPLPLPPLPSPPVYVPGLGFQPVEQLLQKLAPPLSQTEEVYLQSLLEVTAGLLGMILNACLAPFQPQCVPLPPDFSSLSGLACTTLLVPNAH